MLFGKRTPRAELLLLCAWLVGGLLVMAYAIEVDSTARRQLAEIQQIEAAMQLEPARLHLRAGGELLGRVSVIETASVALVTSLVAPSRHACVLIRSHEIQSIDVLGHSYDDLLVRLQRLEENSPYRARVKDLLCVEWSRVANSLAVEREAWENAVHQGLVEKEGASSAIIRAIVCEEEARRARANAFRMSRPVGLSAAGDRSVTSPKSLEEGVRPRRSRLRRYPMTSDKSAEADEGVHAGAGGSSGVTEGGN